MQKAAQAYFQTQVSTTSQGELLLMLYDGAVKFLRQAQEKIQEKDYAQKGILISKALDVIAELDSSLNAQKGGEIAQNLHNLYFYCNTRLLLANMNMDNALIDEVINILTGLRSAYSEIIESQGGVKPTAPQKASTNGNQAGPRPPLLLNKEGGEDHPTQAQQTQEPTPAQERPGASPLESLATQIARNPAKPKPQAAAEPDAAEPQKSDTAEAPQTRPAPDPAQQIPQQANAPQEQSQQETDAEKPAAPKPGPNRGRLLAGASIYKKMANQS